MSFRPEQDGASQNRPPYDIWVRPGSGIDLYSCWTLYKDTRRLILTDGTYTLPAPLIIDDKADSRTITLVCRGKNVKITGSAGCVDDYLIRSDVSAPNKGATELCIEGSLHFVGSSASNEIGAWSLDNVKMQFGVIRVTGLFKNGGTEYAAVCRNGTGGDTNAGGVIQSLTISLQSAVYTLLYLKCDVLTINSLALNHADANGTVGLTIENSVTISHFGYYIGNGRTCTTLIYNPSGAIAQLTIGRLSADKTTTGALTNVFNVDNTGSHFAITHMDDKAGTVGTNLFADAATQAQVFILGTYNGKCLSQVFTNKGDGATCAHGLVRTPHSCQLTITVAGEMGTVTTLDATNVTIAIRTHAGAAGTAQTVYCLFKM